MLLLASTKECGSRYRGIVRLDDIEYHLAGLHDRQTDAYAQATATIERLRAGLKKSLSTRSMFTAKTHAGRLGK